MTNVRWGRGAELPGTRRIQNTCAAVNHSRFMCTPLLKCGVLTHNTVREGRQVCHANILNPDKLSMIWKVSINVSIKSLKPTTIKASVHHFYFLTVPLYQQLLTKWSSLHTTVFLRRFHIDGTLVWHPPMCRNLRVPTQCWHLSI